MHKFARFFLVSSFAFVAALGLSGCTGAGDRAALEAAKVREVDEAPLPVAGHGHSEHDGHDHSGHDHSAHASEASAPAPEGQKVEIESHDHKMDPRLKEKPATAAASAAAAGEKKDATAATGEKKDACCEPGAAKDAKHQCKEGDDECAGSASSKEAAAGEAAEAGSGTSNCSCGKEKPGCRCGHCSGVIGECHCRHGK